LFRTVLPDDVGVKELFDFRRARQPFSRRSRLFALFIFQNRLADAHALVADVRARIVGRRADQFFPCSCVLWQKEQRKGSSVLYFFTGVKASPPPGLVRSS